MKYVVLGIHRGTHNRVSIPLFVQERVAGVTDVAAQRPCLSKGFDSVTCYSRFAGRARQKTSLLFEVSLLTSVGLRLLLLALW